MDEKLAATLQDAWSTVVTEAHGRAFLGRLAELGHVPQTEKEAYALLDLGFKLAAVEAQPEFQKAASANAPVGPYEAASQHLDQFLTGTVKQAATGDEPDDACWAIAAELAQDSRVFSAATLVKAAQEGLL